VSGLVGLTHLEERTLVLAPIGRDGALAVDILRRAELAAVEFRDPASLARAVQEGAGAMLIAEEALSPEALRILAGALDKQPPWSDLPVLVFVAPGERHAFPDRLEWMSNALGNVTVVERPVRVATLVTAVRAALRARRRQYAARATMEALQLREAELRVADQRKDEFLAMLAHELRNPMAALSVALELLATGEEGSPRATRLHATARRQIQHLVRLVDDLLEISRITRGTFELRRVDLDLRGVFEAAVNDARPLLEARDIVLAVTSTTGSVPIHADATRVEQVISNLLSNAAKFTEPGGRVEISLGVSGEEALVVVRDTGRGIPDRMTDQVFEPFVQVDPGLDRAKGGLGLGLTLVRRLVEMHGGRVAASSGGPGRGSTFEVRLPLRVVEKKLVPSAGHAPLEERGPPRRVLVVEDSIDVRETLAEFLRSLGHEVELAATGPEGAEKLVAVQPDVALVDIGLPGMDGYEVARTVRERPEGRSLFLVALTGYGGAEVEATALRAGFDVHLVKPVETARLLALIEGAPMSNTSSHRR